MIPSQEKINAVIKMLSVHAYPEEFMNEIKWDPSHPDVDDSFALDHAWCIRLLKGLDIPNYTTLKFVNINCKSDTGEDLTISYIPMPDVDFSE